MKLPEFAWLVKLLELPAGRSFRRPFAVILRVFVATVRGFMKDDCFMKASGIAYTAIVSMIPMLTVALALLTITSGLNEKKELLYDEVNSFLLKHNILFDLNPYLETLNGIINAATQIGAIGFVVFIFSATAVLRSFESSFNQIWGIRKDRPFLNKIIFYFFILAIGPLVFAGIEGMSGQILMKARKGHLLNLTTTSDKSIWIAGEKGSLIKVDETGKRISSLKDLKMDIENIQCLGPMGEAQEVCNTPNLKKANFLDVQSHKDSIFAITDSGILLTSSDRGLNWNLTFFSGTSFKGFSVVDESVIFLLLANGEILRYSKNGISYKPIFKEVLKMNAVTIRFFNDKTGFILDATGGIWKSNDGGESFQGKKLSPYPLNDIDFLNRNVLVVAGDRGKFFLSTNGGVDWLEKTHKKYSMNHVWVYQKGSQVVTIIVNDIGQILTSLDYGDNWKLSYHPEKGKLLSLIPVNKNSLMKFEQEEEEVISGENEAPIVGPVSGEYLAVGEFNRISVGSFTGETINWKHVQGGFSYFSIYAFLKMLLPLTGIWVFFLMLYTFIPNTTVPFSASAIGSAITGLIFLFFLWAFGIYITSFSETTMIVYKALAAIPIFLLSVYSVSLIILFGAELTSVIHNKARYLYLDAFLKEKKHSGMDSFRQAIVLLEFIYKYQRKKGRFPADSIVKKELNMDTTDFGFVVETLLDSELLVKTENDQLAPCRPSESLNYYDVFRIFSGNSNLESISPEMKQILEGFDQEAHKSLSKHNILGEERK